MHQHNILNMWLIKMVTFTITIVTKCTACTVNRGLPHKCSDSLSYGCSQIFASFLLVVVVRICFLIIIVAICTCSLMVVYSFTRYWCRHVSTLKHFGIFYSISLSTSLSPSFFLPPSLSLSSPIGSHYTRCYHNVVKLSF